MLNCPYKKMGCKIEYLFDDEMKNHLQSEGITHSKLLIDQINSLQRNINLGNCRFLVQENTTLNDKLTTVSGTITCDNATIKACLMDIKNQIDEAKKEAELVKARYVQLDSLLFDLKQSDENINTEIQLIKKDCEPLLENFNNKTKNITNGNLKKYDLNNKMNEVQDITNELLETCRVAERRNALEFETCCKLINGRILRLKSDLSCYHNGDYIWRINEFHNKLNSSKYWDTTVFSDDFLSHKNGYLLQLSLKPNGENIGLGKYVSIFFSIKVGPYDDILTWPMRNEVIISIINPKTGKDYCTKYFKYNNSSPVLQNVFNKPTQFTYGYGIYQFIEHNELQKSPSLLMNDQIIIKCSVK